jgi:hypothetical protein
MPRIIGYIFYCGPQSKYLTGAGGMAQVVEHLPSKCKALSSTPSTLVTALKGLGQMLFWDLLGQHYSHHSPFAVTMVLVSLGNYRNQENG